MTVDIPGLTWVNPGPARFDLEPGVTVDLIVEVKARTRLVLKTVFPPGAAAESLRILMFPEGEVGGIEFSEIEPAAVPGTNVVEKAYEVPRGEYTIWVFSANGDGKAGAGYFGEGKVTIGVGGTSELRLDMAQGAILRGRVLDAQGQPAAATELYIKAYPFVAFKNPAVRVVRSDFLGNFVVSGLPPLKSLRVMSSESPLQSGPPGSETRADVRLSR